MPHKIDCEFLSEAGLSNRIRQICDAQDVDCAVAFWGVGIKRDLFPRWSTGKIRVVCDISMGATCRAALHELGAPRNANLRVNDGLHSKVYISERGAVIGSPNASENGVGRNGSASGRLLEAGVFCPAGSKAHAEVAQWFNALFNQASMVGQAELLRAPERSGELRLRGSRETLAGLSLLRRLRDYPQNFAGVHIAIAGEALDEKKAAASTKERAKRRGAKPEKLKDSVIFQCPEEGKLVAFTGPVLQLWRPRSITWVTAYTDGSTWPPSDADTVFAIKDWRRFWKEIDQTPSEKRLSDEDSSRIGQLLDADDEQWFFTPEEFAGRLAMLWEKPSPKMSKTQARAVLTEELDRVGGKTVSAFMVGDTLRPEAATLAWWHAKTPTATRSNTPRTQAYLRAYLRIAGDAKLYAGGVLLDLGRLWMDRSVISRLERDGYLSFMNLSPEPWFELTQKGEAFVGTILPL